MTGGRIRWKALSCCSRPATPTVTGLLHHDGYSFPTWDPPVRLDYLFTPGRFAGLVKQCEVVRSGPVREASDHFPLLSVIDEPQS